MSSGTKKRPDNLYTSTKQVTTYAAEHQQSAVRIVSDAFGSAALQIQDGVNSHVLRLNHDTMLCLADAIGRFDTDNFTDNRGK